MRYLCLLAGPGRGRLHALPRRGGGAPRPPGRRPRRLPEGARRRPDVRPHPAPVRPPRAHPQDHGRERDALRGPDPARPREPLDPQQLRLPPAKLGGTPGNGPRRHAAPARRLVRATEIYEIAARLAPDSPQLQSDTGLTFEFYPCTRDDARARTYFCRAVALDPAGLNRDAWNGLLRIDARAGDWPALRGRAARIIAGLEKGESAIAPSGEGPPRELPPRARAMFLRRAKAALRLAEARLAARK